MHKSLLALLTCAAAGTLPAQWTQVTPATSPASRSGHAMALDPYTNTLLMFGGAGIFTTFNDTWTYDGTNWTQLLPPTSPTAKFYMDIAYDSFRAVYVMYGGNATYTSPGTNQTWEFDGTTWTQRFPATNPGNLGLHAMVFDSARNKVVLYGGMPGGNPIVDSSKTWEYDGTNWVQRFPATNPGPREAHSMCFHEGVGKTILFGGVNATSGATPPYYNNKTWAYDGTNWTELTIAGARPGMRERASMSYDSVRGACVLTGGLSGGSTGGGSGSLCHDTWELKLTGTTWTWTLVDNPTTGGRLNSAMAFLPSDRHVVKFGGMNAAGSTVYGETKEWGAQRGTFGFGCLGTNGVPALSAADAPRLGQSYTLNLSNLDPTFNLAVLAFGFTELPGVDLGPLLGMWSCPAYTTPDILITISGAAGSANWVWPTVSGAAGDRFYGQALCFDPTVNAFGFTISNAVAATIGY